MYAVLSPAKKLDFSELPREFAALPASLPRFLDEACELAEVARTLSRGDLMRLMSISENLADLNYARFQEFAPDLTPENARPAVLAFSGDTYIGLEARSLQPEELEYAGHCVGILSGLYGLLRPLDLIRPYRLEMGSRLNNPRGEDLYSFWKSDIAPCLDQHAESAAGEDGPLVINLASSEYFRAVDRKALKSRVVTAHFKEIKDGQSRTLGLYAKRARGSMARYIIRNRCTRLAELKDFQEGGYIFQPELSTDSDWIFSRQMPQKKSA